MILEIKKFGLVLSSRSDGREAALTTLAYFKNDKKDSQVEVDFKDIIVMTPSWLSEFVQTLKEKGIQQVSFLKSQNPSVISSIEIIQDEIS